MTPRQIKRFRKQFAEQVEQERNGAPIPPEIAALMTKRKAPEVLYQLVVTVAETGKLLPVGPAMIKDACGLCAAAINKQIALGRERTWKHVAIVPLTPIAPSIHGVN